MQKQLAAGIGMILGCGCALAQSPGYDALSTILTGSTSQWICRSLEAEHPGYFLQEDCPPQFNLVNLSESNDRVLFGLPEHPELQSKFTLLILKEDCDRFIHLKALSDYYLPLIDSLLRASDLPTEYRMLPVAQSALNTSFDDPSGKAGLWGMKSLESARFGIKLNDEIDYRYHFNISTLSAVEKLKHLHLLFGDVLLVYVAFNEGVRATQLWWEESGKNIDRFLDRLPITTREWLYFAETAAELFNYLETPDYASGVDRVQAMLSTVYPVKRASIAAYSAVLGLDSKLVSRYNPWYTSDFIPGNELAGCRIPAEYKEAFESLQDSIYAYDAFLEEMKRKELEAEALQRAAAFPSSDSHEERTHKVRSGDVLGGIANKYNVSVSDLKRWNNLRRDVIYIGQELIVYVPRKLRVNIDTEPETPRQTGEDASGEYTLYTVRSGDNLWLIAQEYPGVSAEDIMRWNGIGEDLRPGQKLKIYSGNE